MGARAGPDPRTGDGARARPRRVAFRRDAGDLAAVVRPHGELVAKREAAIAAHNEAMRLLGLEIGEAKSLVVAFEGRVEQLAGRQAR